MPDLEEGTAEVASQNSVPETQQPQQSSNGQEQPPSPPDLEKQVADLAAKVTTLEGATEQAKREATNATQEARRAKGQHQSRVDQLERELRLANSQLEQLTVRVVPPEELNQVRMAQELERLKRERETPQNSVTNDEAVSSFEQWAIPVLQARSLAANDPQLQTAFEQHRAGSADPSIWRAALGFAIADVEAARARMAREEGTERERKAREEERAKARAETRGAEGRLDRGSPVAAGRKNVWEMTDKEFDDFERVKDASVGRQHA